MPDGCKYYGCAVPLNTLVLYNYGKLRITCKHHAMLAMKTIPVTHHKVVTGGGFGKFDLCCAQETATLPDKEHSDQVCGWCDASGGDKLWLNYVELSDVRSFK